MTVLRCALPVWTLLAVLCGSFAAAHEPLLKDGDHVGVIGDSITEQKQYSVFIEDYLLMCQPAANLRQTQFGWSGETAPGYAGRMANDTLRFKPTVITTCFGMNDGGYSPMTPEKADRYRQATQSIIDQAKKAGVREIVVGSPGAVDLNTFRNDPAQAEMYNKTLAALRDIARETAEKNHTAFANVHDAMYQAMVQAKAQYGPQYHVCGGDGFHPDANGQFVMAYAFLKALGCNGDIASIRWDYGGKKAEVSAGHKAAAVDAGKLELESTRYPFCFYGDPKSPGSTAGIVPFTPFNEELNRFALTVSGLSGARYKLTWGNQTKEFSKEQLEKGINLAAEFVENPFSEPFRQVDGKVREQQNYETPLVKDLITRLPGFKNLVPGEAESLEKVATAAIVRDEELFKSAAAAVQPVKHTLTLEEVK